jgi:DNA-binding SARP family transcriptional activator
MPKGDQLTRSFRYSASRAHTSSIDDDRNSSGSPPSADPTSARTNTRSGALQTRTVTTHVKGSPTKAQPARLRSTTRLRLVRRRVPGTARVPVQCCLRLLNGFEAMVGGRTIDLAANSQRVLAFLALRERPQLRGAIAGALWLDRSDRRAAANLRTALWKLGPDGRSLMTSRAGSLAIADDVVVDFRAVIRLARGLLNRPAALSRHLDCDVEPTVDMFAGDLLPDWDDDWILFERERLRQLRIHAIEALSRRFAMTGRFAEAVDAGLAAVAADSLRESAHRVLIEAYLGEGNVADARRQLDLYRTVLWDSLRLQPSADLDALLGAS